jgi:hypothetical protein
MTILDAMQCWPEFKHDSWASRKSFLRSLFGLPLSDIERETFVQHTGRTALFDPPANHDTKAHADNKETSNNEGTDFEHVIGERKHQANEAQPDTNTLVSSPRFLSHGANIRARTAGFNEAWVIVGRRGGKSRFTTLVAVYVALFRDHSAVPASLVLIACNRVRTVSTASRY